MINTKSHIEKLDESQFGRQKKQLARIDKALSISAFFASPRLFRAVFFSVMLSLFAAILGGLPETISPFVAILKHNSQLFMAPLMITTSLIGYFSTTYNDWTDVLFDLLAEYEPINVDAYKLLQTKVKTDGLRFRCVEEWIELEKEFLHWDLDQSSRRSRFIERQL